MLPALGILALFFLGPALYNVFLSFQNISLFDMAKGGEWVGLGNFAKLLGDPLTGLALKNTVLWLTISTVVLRVSFGLLLALLMNAKVMQRKWLAGLARSLVLIPWVTPPVVAVAAWQWLLHARYGAINQILMQLDVLQQGIPFLARTSTVWWAIVAIVVWRELPFVVISLLAGLQSIPAELYEAARIDGASEGAVRILHPAVPAPGLAVVMLLTTIWTFNNFLYVWLTTRGGPGRSPKCWRPRCTRKPSRTTGWVTGPRRGADGPDHAGLRHHLFQHGLQKQPGPGLMRLALRLGQDLLVVAVTFGLLLALAVPPDAVAIPLSYLRPRARGPVFRHFPPVRVHGHAPGQLPDAARQDQLPGTYILNSLVVSLASTLLAVTASLLAAYSFLSRRRFPLRSVHF